MQPLAYMPQDPGQLAQVALGYQSVLARNPCHPAALIGMSLVALASHQPEAAVTMAQAGVATAPLLPAAWVALGQALKAAGQLDQAEQAYREALRCDGMDPLAHLGLGELMLATRRPAEAVEEFALALRRQPGMVSAIMGLGNALALQGRNDAALLRYEQALALHPGLAEAEFAAGYVLSRLGHTALAETRYRRSLALRPDFAAAWLNLGCLLRESGSEVFAEAALRRAVKLRPDLIAGWINLALLHREQQRHDEAAAHLGRAFALDPDLLETQLAWCQFCAATADLAGARAWLRWALARDPQHPEAVNMHGILLHTERRFAEAVAVFEQAEALGSPSAASNRGNSLLDLGRMDEALRAHEQAAAHDLHSPGAAYNLALTRLRLGHWEPGWAGYEARWRFREVHRMPRRFAQPRWQGQELRGQTILLHAEQGLGDTLQFCRYAALVAARGGRPLLQVQPATARLLRSLAVVRAGLATVCALGSEPPPFQLECPLLSLPAVFRTTVDTVPWPGAYLAAEPQQVAGKRAAFAAAGLRVGLAWAGNPRYKADAQRSMRLRQLLPLLRTPGITWFSLQKGEAADQLAALPGEVSLVDACSRDRDLAETAALMATLDLVLSTDTCIPHLAAAMGKPVWLLLPHLADWRWMEQAATTPWYPTMRLFRQPRPEDWPSVLQQVHEELAVFAQSHR